MSSSADKLLASALERLKELSLQEAFDPMDPRSRPTSAQQQIIDDFGTVKSQWIVAANRSGKSQTCARLIAWALTDTHPTWRVPVEWMREGLLIIVAGKNSKQIEESLWHKIRSYLVPGTYKEVRSGNILQKVEVETALPEVKHRIVFQSMENVNVARERVQSYDAHIAWADEMIDSARALSEIRIRVRTKGGFFLCSFTPLKSSMEVKRLVDGATLPHGRKYVLKTLDNPVFVDPTRRDELLADFVGVSEEERKTRLEGEWASGESSVYHFDYDTMVVVPEVYSPVEWRHVEAVDPAMKSALGLTIWAENPTSGIWYCVVAKYLKGLYAPSDWVDAVRKITRNYNIVRRVSDTAPWFVHQASTMGVHYVSIYNKANRKSELIKGLQEKLGTKIFLTPACEDLIIELEECRWSDKAEEKMVNSSSYHLLDSAQYFCDNIPKTEHKGPSFTSFHVELLKANQKRIEMENRIIERAEKRATRMRIRRAR